MDSDKNLTSTEQEKAESLLWEYLEEGEYDYQQPQRGSIRKGTILRKDADQIIVDIGSKREGIVPTTDLEKLGPDAVAELEVGDEVPVYVLVPETSEGDIIVSINLARQMADWKRAEELMEAEEIIEKKVTGFNKGGLLIQFDNLQGFIPRSHIVNLDGRTQSGPPQDRLNQMVGQELPLKIIEVNQKQRRLILSERAAWREWRSEQKKRLLENLEVGDVRTGTVSSLADFGAFVDLGGADGLIHISELSWDHGKKPSDVVQVGDKVDVKIIDIDRERQRIGLSLKQLKPDPWGTIEDRYAIGHYIDVEVTNLVKFGAFARLEEGIEGLIHISELAEHNVQHPSELLEPSQSLTVQIISLEPERRRIGLSLRRVPDHLRTPIEAEEEEIEKPEEAPAKPEEATAESPVPSKVEVTEPTEAEVEEAGTEGEVSELGPSDEAEERPETEAAPEKGSEISSPDTGSEESIAQTTVSAEGSTRAPVESQTAEVASTAANMNGDQGTEKAFAGGSSEETQPPPSEIESGEVQEQG